MELIKGLNKNFLSLGGYFVAVLILLSGILHFTVKNDFKKQNGQLSTGSSIENQMRRLGLVAATVDVNARNHFINQDSKSKDEYAKAVFSIARCADSLKNELKTIGSAVSTGIDSDIQQHIQYLAFINQQNNELAPEQFNALPVLSSSVYKLSQENKKTSTASDSSSILTGLTVLQIILLFCVPLVIVLNYAYNNLSKKLLGFNQTIEESNRKYVFNSVTDVAYENGEIIIDRLLLNLKKATDFIQQVSKGNYEIQWEGMDAHNQEMNRDNIAGELLRMRDQMKQVKEEDRIRIWMTEGLSQFGEVIRKNQNNFDALLDLIIANIVKYLDAQVGGLFIVSQEDNENHNLQLRACYAYNRKKFITKEVALGEGLIGQAYLESNTIYLKEIPQQYMSITSGLGESNPRSLIVVPLKANERVEGVLELASFREFQPHEIEFLEKLGETLASSIVNLHTGEKTRMLLEVSQSQTEEMRAQEEEMRQNMEELEATQEQMARQMQELSELKQNLEKEKYLFASLMDNLPDMIYYKDLQSKLIRISKHMSKHFGKPEEDLIGKSDFDFQDHDHAQEAYNDEQNIIKTRKAKVNYVEKETRVDGTESWVSTTKMPLINLQGEVVGTFGISRDVSALKKLEQEVALKDKKLREEEKEYEEKINQLEEALKAYTSGATKS